MALEIGMDIKNRLLNKSFVEVETLYLSIPSVPGASGSSYLPNVKIGFKESTSGILKLSSPVFIVAPSNTTVNMLYISTNKLTNSNIYDLEYDAIRITGEDIITYDTNGIYVVEEINIGITTL